MKKKRSRGQALVELAIVAPWIFLMFIYAVDTGFCLVAAIGVQNAARAAALYYATTSSPTFSNACTVVTNQLQSLPNPPANCSSVSLQLTVTTSTKAPAVITVTYQTQLPIYAPLFPSGTKTIARSATYATRPN